MDWIYANSLINPDYKEEVLCDLGEAFYFTVLVYESDGCFYDSTNNDCYYSEINVKRWAHIGKHCDQEF